MRKLFIGFISLAFAFGVFLLYSRVDKTPQIESSEDDDFINTIGDGNVPDFNNVGKIGDTGIGRSQKVHFITRNEMGVITDEFGFETLISDKGGVWELEKPYRTIFQPDFICYLTADTGRVQVEKIADEIIFRDATFSKNVVVHIEPRNSMEIKESYIFLDDLDFISDKSLLTTDGPVKFISEDTQLLGTGMELIYDGVLERLEYFKVVDLESLRFKMLRSIFETQSKVDENIDKKVEKQVVSDTEEQINTADLIIVDNAKTPEPEQKEYYTCIFSKNVLVDTPEQLIFARNEVRIHDILWSGYNESIADTNAGILQKDNIIDSNETNESEESQAVFADGEPNKPDVLSQEYVDVIVTCDGGFIVTPRDLESRYEEEAIEETASDIIRPEIPDSNSERTTLFTRKISYTMLEEDTIAEGPTELTIYVEDQNIIDPNNETFPVTVTSYNGARFSKAENQAVFDVNCVCTIPQRDLSVEKNAIVSSQRLTVQFPGNNLESVSKLSDIVALGPAEMIFYIEDSNRQTTENPIPVKINAKEQILYLSEAEQIIFEGDCLCTIPQKDLGEEYDFKLRSPMLTAGLPEGQTGQSFALSDIVAIGPVGIDFYMKDPNADASDKPLPIKVTAQGRANFLSSSNEIVLEDSCKTYMQREDPNYIQEFTLLSDLMTIDLSKETDSRTSSKLTGFKRLIAEGGEVTLSVVKKAKTDLVSAQRQEPGKVLAWTELICNKLDYDTVKQLFLATGPGKVTLSDSVIKDTNKLKGDSITKKQWWAIVRNFDSLKYLPNENRITAKAKPKEILSIDYTSVQDGEYGPVIIATAGSADIQLTETPEGKAELLNLIASGGIDYKDDGNRFFGSMLFYNHEKSTMLIEGDEIHPCYYNGLLISKAEYNLETRNVKTKILGGGI